MMIVKPATKFQEFKLSQRKRKQSIFKTLTIGGTALPTELDASKAEIER